MKKSILLLSLIAITVGVKGQGKTKYYKTTVEFQTTDGCYMSATNTNWYNNAYSANYDGVLAVTTKWVRPYKIKSGTFKITSMQRVSKKDILHKSEKFEPCNYKPLYLSNYETLSTADTSIHFTYVGGYVNKGNYTWLSKNKDFLSVSGVDTSGTTTVKFLRSEVKFINDSTFTFKQNLFTK